MSYKINIFHSFFSNLSIYPFFVPGLQEVTGVKSYA